MSEEMTGIVIMPVSNNYCKPFVNELGTRKGKSRFVSFRWMFIAFAAQDNERFFSHSENLNFGGGGVYER